MSKAWVIFFLVGWTVVLWVLAPFLYSFKKTSTMAIEGPEMLGLPRMTCTVITEQPILDWSGRLAASHSEIRIGDKLVYSSVPGRSVFKWDSALLADYEAAIGPDGKPKFSKKAGK